MYRYLISLCLAYQKVTSLQSACFLSIIKGSQDSQRFREIFITLFWSAYMDFHLAQKNGQ